MRFIVVNTTDQGDQQFINVADVVRVIHETPPTSILVLSNGEYIYVYQPKFMELLGELNGTV